MERILIWMAAETFAQAEESLQSAVSRADSPKCLSAGLLLRREPDAQERERMSALPAPRYIVGGDPLWYTVGEGWQGEDWVLLGTPAMRFEKGWDRKLTRSAQQLQRRSGIGAVLTGCLPAAADPLRAVCPVAADHFAEDGSLLLRRGVPLRYAAEDEPGALIHSGFCFARAAFFKDVKETGWEPFWTAFKRRWAVYTLGEPVIGLTEPAPLPPVRTPEDPEARERFARHFGIDFNQRTVSEKAREGVWRPNLTAPVRIPLRTRFQEAFRGLDNLSSKLTPLVVTAWRAESGIWEPSETELVRFRRLSGMRNVSMVCFADGRSLRPISRIQPNTLELSPKIASKLPKKAAQADPEAAFTLSKTALLAAARNRYPDRSHYVWMDFDYLGYPVYPRAAVDWDVVCTQRITMAWAAGRPDPSMICVPDAEVLPLQRDFAVLCRAAMSRADRLPAEAEVWRNLALAFPARFELVELPGPGELFGLTMPGRDEEW